MIRRAVVLSLLPLTILTGGLASAPWLRAFPSDVLAVPLFGAALLSVAVPMVTVALLSRSLWVTALIDAGAFVLYALLAVLHSPAGLGELVSGLVHGPSQVLTFALPLVSPRSLLVAPVALCWLAGAIAGECLARSWSTVVPYAGWLAAFGLAYAATERAVVADVHQARRYDTLLAAGLLVSMLLLRAVQSWVRQDGSAQPADTHGLLPMRSLLAGAAVTALVATLASATVQASTFARAPKAAQRVPSVNESRPVTPVSFVADLRPSNPKDPGSELFSVTVDRTAPAYIGLANLDFYDGEGWTFTRTFRPSGGVVPADADPALHPAGPAIGQRYEIRPGALTSTPWMPLLYRPQKITETTVNVDADSGMVVPARPLRPGDGYTVHSRAVVTQFDQLGTAALPASASSLDTLIPGSLVADVNTVVTALAADTGAARSSPVAFLQSVLRVLRTDYALSARTPGPARPTPGPAGPSPRPPARPSPTPSPTRGGGNAGGTAFADVLASVFTARAATPEQYATLFALVARNLGVPARVVTGFRAGGTGTPLPAGTYPVTAGQAWTWVEIPVRGQGWVVADPSPGTYSNVDKQESVGAQPSPSPTAVPTQTAVLTQANGGHAVAPRSTVHHAERASHTPLVGTLLAGLALLAAVLLGGLLLRKTRRIRRRRRNPDPRLRVLGAWRESLDLLAEAGTADLTRCTSAEVCAATAAHFGESAARRTEQLGAAANAAMYQPSAAVSPEQADTAWRLHGELRTLVRRRLGLRHKLYASLAYHRGDRTPRRRDRQPLARARKR